LKYPIRSTIVVADLDRHLGGDEGLAGAHDLARQRAEGGLELGHRLADGLALDGAPAGEADVHRVREPVAELGPAQHRHRRRRLGEEQVEVESLGLGFGARPGEPAGDGEEHAGEEHPEG
jgi:hypothetical protein